MAGALDRGPYDLRVAVRPIFEPPPLPTLRRNEYGHGFVSGALTEPGGDVGDNNQYTFKMSDASEPGVAQVLILDGQVFGPNNDGILPAGMGNDDYILPVAGDGEIYIIITFDAEGDDGVSGEQVTSMSIAAAPETPDDDGLTMYWTIGAFSVDYSTGTPFVNTTNFQCGDVVIWLPPDLGGGGEDTDPDLALVVDKNTGNRVWKKVCASA